jgi:hypothetical protein
MLEYQIRRVCFNGHPPLGVNATPLSRVARQ